MRVIASSWIEEKEMTVFYPIINNKSKDNKKRERREN